MKSRKNGQIFRFVTGIFILGATIVLQLPFVLGKTPSEYRKNIKNANLYVKELLTYITEYKETNRRDLQLELRTLNSIRQILPPKEKIGWEGNLIEANNQWIADKLKDFEETEDWKKREQILLEISERLSAIEQKIIELEKKASENLTKDEIKRKIAGILQREEYRKPEPPEESFLEGLLRTIEEWLNKTFPRPDIPESTPEGLKPASFIFQILLYAVVIGIISFLVYRFALFPAAKLRRRERKDKQERVILGEKLKKHEDSRSLFDEAEKLAREGNLRAAIRKGYIALLCDLSERKLIGLARHKTNRDYLREVRKNQMLYENMRGLTDSFERHCYGFDQANLGDWEEFRQGYRQTLSVTSRS
jgi:hypothetical protein